MSTSSPRQPALFEENERVLAHHQGLIYEAKVELCFVFNHKLIVPRHQVLSVEWRPDPSKKIEGKKKPYYQIHYQGWNDRFVVIILFYAGCVIISLGGMSG
jgi:hypothetical protein